MQSLANKLKESGYNIVNPKLFKEVEALENLYHATSNRNKDLAEENESLIFQIQNDDQKCLVDISKKLNETLKSVGQNEMINQLMLERAKILDHFTMAYMAELNLKPSEVKLIQSVNHNGDVEMYFEKHSNIIV